MTQDEIIEMVREAGGSDVGGHGWTTWVGTQSTEFLERFANLVAAKEREALAQPEQEPVQYKCTVIDDQHPNGIPLEQWTPPPQRKPLTDEQRKDLMNKAWNKWLGGEDDNHLFAWHFSFEVEAAHGIKGDA